MNRVASAAAVAFAAVLGAAACGGKDSDPGAGRAADRSGSGSAAAQPPARRAPPDAAYIVLRDKGLVAIEGGAFRTIVDDKYVGGRALAAPGGGLWIYVGDQIVRYDGEVTPLPDAPRKFGVVALGPDGALWASGAGLASYDGKAWKKHALPDTFRNPFVRALVFAAGGARYGQIGSGIVVGRGDTWTALTAGDAPVSDLALAGDGTIYVATRGQLAKLVNDKLAPIVSLKNESPQLLTAPDGAIYVFTLQGASRLAGDKLEPLPDMPFTTGQVFGADGTLYGIPLGGMRIVRRRAGGAVDQLPAGKDLPFKARSITVDARGRLWLVLEYGMALLDGERLTLLTPGTVPELKRNVEAIVVTGKGPDLPDVGPPKLINLKGNIVAQGKPKAGVKIELCPEVSGVFYGASPCESKSFVRRATSGADGSFTLADVPLGGWHIIYKKSADAWVFYFPPGCCGGLPKGATFDMGDIEFGTSSR